MAKTKEEWLATIQGLLAKAESPATPEEERYALMDKVFYLSAKFGIEDNVLKAKENMSVDVVVRRYKKSNPYANDRLFLLADVARSFGCRTVNDPALEQIVVIGHEDDQERVFMLYGSLVMQMIIACEQAYLNKPANIHGKAFKNSFVKGFRIRVSHRLRDAYDRARADSVSESTGTDVVLYNRETAVSQKVREIYPRLRTINASSRISTEAGYNAGQHAANRADIGQTRMGSKVVRQLGS